MKVFSVDGRTRMAEFLGSLTHPGAVRESVGDGSDKVDQCSVNTVFGSDLTMTPAACSWVSPL